MTKWFKRAVTFLGILFTSSVVATSFPAVPTPFQYVSDYTKTLSSQDKTVLESKLANYSRDTSSQIAVVIIPSVGEYDISQYAFELGDKWGIGRKQLNNGVLMLIAKNDRKIFIAVGQGLEGVLPDAFLSQVIRNHITPYFKQGQYTQGIEQGLHYIIAASKGEFEATQIDEETWEKYIPFIMVVIFILFVFFGEFAGKPYISPTNHHSGQVLRRQSTLSRRSRSYGGSGFGGFDGRGGSGGGFGGGSFGGGGAGGSW